MTYVPPNNSSSTLRVFLGSVVNTTGAMIKGSAAVSAPGMNFDSSEVGFHIMVYYAGDPRTGNTNAAPLVSTISSVSGPDTATLADAALNSTPTDVPSAVVLFRPRKCKTGSISYHESITVKGNASFIIQTNVGDPMPLAGQPFLLKDADLGPRIGGFLLTVNSIHYPGSNTIEHECEGVTWDHVLGRTHLDILTNNPGGRSLGSIQNIVVDNGGVYASTSDTQYIHTIGGSDLSIGITSTSGGVTVNAAAHVGQMEYLGPATTGGLFLWAIRSIIIDDPGQGYTTAPTITVLGGSPVTQATAHAVLADVSLNALQSVQVTFAGLYDGNYPPTVKIEPPPTGGTQATAHAVLVQLGSTLSHFWQLDHVVIDNGGSGYINPPAITFVDSGGGHQQESPVAVASLVAIPTETGGVLGQTPNPLNGTFLGAKADYIINWLLDNIRGGMGAAGIGYGTIVEGPVIRTITFDYSHTIGSAIDAVVNAINDGVTDYLWSTDPFGRVSFQLNTAVAAPWSINDGDGSDGNVLAHIEVTNSLEKFVLKAFVSLQSAVLSTPLVEKFRGDNTTKSFNVTQGPLSSAPTITIVSTGLRDGNIITVTSPVKVVLLGTPEPTSSSEGTFTWYWTPGSSSIKQADSGKALGTEDQLTVSYLPSVKTIVSATADSTIISDRQAIEGGAGAFYDTYIDNNNSGPVPIQDGQSLAQALANYFSKKSTQIKVVTYRKGLSAGAVVTVNLTDYNVGGNFLVTDLALTTDENMQMWTTTLAAGAIIGDWRKAMADLTHSSSPFIGAGVGGAGNATPNVPVVYKVTKVVAELEQSGTFTDANGVDHTIVDTHWADQDRGVHVVVDITPTLDPVLAGEDNQTVSYWLIRKPNDPSPMVTFLGQAQISVKVPTIKLDRYAPDSEPEEWQAAVKFGVVGATNDYGDAVLSEVFTVQPPLPPNASQAQNAHFGTIIYGVNDLGQRCWGWLDLWVDLNYDNPDNKSFAFTVQKGHMESSVFVPADDYEGVERQFCDDALSIWVTRSGNTLDILGPPVGGFPIQSPVWTYPDDLARDRRYAFRIYGQDGNGNRTLQICWNGNSEDKGYVTPSTVAARFTGIVPGSQISGLINASLISGIISASMISGIFQASNITINASQIIGIIQASQIAGINASQIFGQILASQISSINANQIFGTITAGQISSINASQINGTINASQINTVNASQISGSITAGQISSINAGTIQGTISASNIGGVFASVISGFIQASSISSIAASKIFGAIQASQIQTVNASQVVGVIEASQINTINASQVIGAVATSFLGTLSASQIVGAILANQISSIAASQITGAIIANSLIGTIQASTITGAIQASQINTIDASQVIGAVTTSFIGTLDASNITGLISATQISTINASQVIGAVTTSFIGTLAASQITGVVQASQINTLTAAQITGVIVTSQLANQILNSLSLFASGFSLPSSMITNVQASQVVGLITALQISTITASQITGIIQASKISSIPASQINGQIAASNIGIISASQISGQIAASNIGSIQASSITGNITINQLSSNIWGTGLVYDPTTGTARVNTNDGSNMVFNPQFDFGLNGFAPDPAYITISNSAYSPPNAARIAGDPVNWHVLKSLQNFPCLPGDAFISACFANGQSANNPLYLYIYFYNAFNQVIGANFDKNGIQQGPTIGNAGIGWTLLQTPAFYAPAGATYCQCLWVGTCTNSFNFWLVDNVTVLKGVTQNQVVGVNASVINGQIAASNIGAISAGSISGQIQSSQIGTVSAISVQGQLSAGQISYINANQINGQLAASSIGLINATSITGQLTANQIGTVNASSINIVGTLNASGTGATAGFGVKSGALTGYLAPAQVAIYSGNNPVVVLGANGSVQGEFSMFDYTSLNPGRIQMNAAAVFSPGAGGELSINDASGTPRVIINANKIEFPGFLNYTGTVYGTANGGSHTVPSFCVNFIPILVGGLLFKIPYYNF